MGEHQQGRAPAWLLFGLGLSGRNEGTLAAHSYLRGQSGIATLPASHVSLGSQVRQQELYRQIGVG